MAAKQGPFGLSPVAGGAGLAAVAAVIAAVFFGNRDTDPSAGDTSPPQAAQATDDAAAAVSTDPMPVETITGDDAAATPAQLATPEPDPDTAAEPAAPAIADAPAETGTAAETETPTVADTDDAPVDQTEDATPEVAATTPADAQDAAAEVAPVTPVPLLSPPTFDVVRAAPDGMTVVAGKSVAGSLVTVLLDGEDVETVAADGGGEFVAILALPSGDRPRRLTLRAALGEQTALSADEIILAPAPSAPAVAEAEPVEQADTAEAPSDEASTPAPAAATAATPDRAEDVAAAQDLAESASEAVAMVRDAPVAQQTPPADPAPVAVLRSDADGVELLQPATPRTGIADAQVVLDTIGYAADGAVLLSGRAAPDALVRIYLDNAPVADLAAGQDGRWRTRLDGVSAGVYTLRLDAIGPDGKVASRLETPFLREAPEALATAEAASASASSAGAGTGASTEETRPAAIRQITVQAGDTLWAISRDRYGDGLLFVRVFEANRDAIRDPDLIYPGQVFTIPD